MLPRTQTTSAILHCHAAKLAVDTTHESFDRPAYLIGLPAGNLRNHIPGTQPATCSLLRDIKL